MEDVGEKILTILYHWDNNDRVDNGMQNSRSMVYCCSRSSILRKKDNLNKEIIGQHSKYLRSEIKIKLNKS